MPLPTIAALIRRIPEVLRPRARVLGVTVLAVLALELTLFNLPHYNSLLAGRETRISVADVMLHDVVYEPASQTYIPSGDHATIELTDLHHRIYSIYVKPVFHLGRTVQPIEIKYDDADSSNRTGGSVRLIDGLPQTNYISPIFMGEVRRLELVFATNEPSADLAEIVLNRTVPLDVNPVRVLVLFGLAVGALAFVRRKAWRYRRDPASRVQRRLNTALVTGLVLYAAAGAILSAPLGDSLADTVDAIMHIDQSFYQRLVDALLQGQVALLEVPDPALLNAPNPYDIGYRHSHGIPYQWDTAYYQGKYYIYFGIVPALLLYLPVKVLTGTYLSTRLVVFIFGAAAAIFLYLFWSRLTSRYFPSIPYVLYLLGGLTLFAGSHLGFFLWQPGDREVVFAGALAFTFGGLWSALKGMGAAGTRPRPAYFAAAALFLALAVGCRPTFALASGLFGVLIWNSLRPHQRASGNRWPQVKATFLGHIPLLIAVAIPYLVVAAGLMYYNFIRFDSVFEFGSSYQLTVANPGAFTDMNPISQAAKAGFGVFAYVFNPLDAQPTFPFVLARWSVNLDGFLGYYYTAEPIGLIAIPIFWSIPFAPFAVRRLRRSRPVVAGLLVVSLILGSVLMVVAALGGGIHARYEADFLWLFTLAALITLVTLYEAVATRQVWVGQVLAGVSTLMVVSTILMTLLSTSSEFHWFAENNPRIYYAIVDFFRLW